MSPDGASSFFFSPLFLFFLFYDCFSFPAFLLCLPFCHVLRLLRLSVVLVVTRGIGMVASDDGLFDGSCSGAL